MIYFISLDCFLFLDKSLSKVSGIISRRATSKSKPVTHLSRMSEAGNVDADTNTLYSIHCVTDDHTTIITEFRQGLTEGEDESDNQCWCE